MATATQALAPEPRVNSLVMLLGQWSMVVGLFVAVFGKVLPGLVRDWSDNATYSYGFIVPVVAGYLVWERRHSLKGLTIAPNYWAGSVLALAVVLALLGQAIGDDFVPRCALVLGLAGTIWFLLGNAWMRALLFPLGYLSLMIPLPYFLIKDLSFQLRFWDAAHSETILRLVGVPVYREAYFLHLPNIVLEVADVCSGISSIFALLAVGVLYAYFLPLPTWLKLIMIVATLPFAIIANLFRIVVTAILAYQFGRIVFETTFHAFSGTFTFLVALIMLIALGESLRKQFTTTGRLNRTVDSRPTDSERPMAQWLVPWQALVIVIALLGSGIYLSQGLDQPRKITLAAPFDDIIVGKEVERPHLAPEDRFRDPHAQSVLSRDIALDDGAPIHLFVGYTGVQGSATRLSSPKLNFPDDWNSEWVRHSALALPGGQTIAGNWMLTRKGQSQQLVYYWYQIGDRSIAGELENRLAQARRAIFQRRTDATVVRLSTTYRDGEGVETAQRRIIAAIAALVPQLVKRLPA